MGLADDPRFRLIAPFLGPVMRLLDDESVSEVMINPSCVFVERGGRLERVAGLAPDQRRVRQAVVAIARLQGDDVGPERPLLNSRLPDGSRVSAALAPCSFGGPAVAIRKFPKRALRLADLAALGSISAAAAGALREAVARRRNVLFSGGTGTGKTTLLGAAARLIPETERLVTIEDTVELQLEHPNLVRFEACRQDGEAAPVTVRELVRAALRFRPDRIVLGEVRGGEAWDLLQALNTGHDGSLSTLHASSARGALKRCTSCVQQSGIGLPWDAVQDLVGDVVDLVVHLERRGRARRVVEVLRVKRFDWPARAWECETLAGEPRGGADGGGR